MNRAWYLSFALLILFFSACAEDEAAEGPSFLTLEERIIQSNTASFYVRANENAGEGMAYFNIIEESDPAPTTSSLKSDASTQSVALSGGNFTLGSFLGLSPGTTYIIYAFMEVDGVEGELVSMKFTTGGWFAQYYELSSPRAVSNMTEVQQKPTIYLFSDGGAEPNPGPGGFGVILQFGKHKKEFSQGDELTTNNRMELMGVIQGLKQLPEEDSESNPDKIIIFYIILFVQIAKQPIRPKKPNES